MQYRFNGLKVEVTRMVPTDDGLGRVCRRVGERVGDVEVTIDVNKLLPLALKALQNKGGEARALRGAVKLKVVNAKTIEEPASASRGAKW